MGHSVRKESSLINTYNLSVLKRWQLIEVQNPRRTAHARYRGNLVREISEKWKSENQVSARAPLFCSVYIAPLTVVNYKADPAAAHAHAFRPAGHTLERPRNH